MPCRLGHTLTQHFRWKTNNINITWPESSSQSSACWVGSVCNTSRLHRNWLWSCCFLISFFFSQKGCYLGEPQYTSVVICACLSYWFHLVFFFKSASWGIAWLLHTCIEQTLKGCNMSANLLYTPECVCMCVCVKCFFPPLVLFYNPLYQHYDYWNIVNALV